MIEEKYSKLREKIKKQITEFFQSVDDQKNM